jgi:hypothetical protein
LKRLIIFTTKKDHFCEKLKKKYYLVKLCDEELRNIDLLKRNPNKEKNVKVQKS